MSRPDDVFDSNTWWDPFGFLVGLRELLNPVRIPYIVRHLRDAEATRVLDVGCGGGFVSSEIERAGFRAFGADPSAAAITEATGHGVVGAVARGEFLPFSDQTFDAAIISEVLEHVDDPAAVMREVVRVLAPDGVLVVTGPNRTWRSRFSLIWFAQEWPTRVLPRGLHEHHKFVRPSEAVALGKSLGLHPVDVVGVGVPFPAILRAAWTYLQLRFGRITYAVAGRRITLGEQESVGVAYMLAMRRK